MKNLIDSTRQFANDLADALEQQADEIERLTAENAELERLHAAVTIQVTQRQHKIDKLTAERDALKAVRYWQDHQPTPQQEFIATATHSQTHGRIEFTGTEALTELLGRFGSGRLVYLYADTAQKAIALAVIEGAKK